MGYSRSGVFELRLPGSRAQSTEPADVASGVGPGVASAVEPGFRLSIRKVSWRSALSVEFPLLVFLAAVVFLSVTLTPEIKLNVFGRAFHLVSLSWFRDLTGVPCLFCGMTRSFVAMGGMELRQAFVFHPLGPVLYGVWTLASLAAGVLFIARRRISLTVGASLRRRIIFAAMGILTLAWAIKLLVWSQAGLL